MNCQKYASYTANHTVNHGLQDSQPMRGTSKQVGNLIPYTHPSYLQMSLVKFYGLFSCLLLTWWSNFFFRRTQTWITDLCYFPGRALCYFSRAIFLCFTQTYSFWICFQLNEFATVYLSWLHEFPCSLKTRT